MKFPNSTVLTIATAAFIWGASSAHAIVYTSEYDGSVLPNLSNPAWTHDYSEGASSVSNGILDISVDTLGQAEAWATSSEWNPTDLGSVLEIRMKVNSTVSGATYAGNFTIATGAAVWIVGFKETGLEDILATNASISLDTVSDFHVYRFEISGVDGDVSIFIDNALVAAAIWENTTPTSSRYLAMGDTITSVVGGNVSIDYVRWTNASVPEPSTMALAILGAGAATVLALRKRRAFVR